MWLVRITVNPGGEVTGANLHIQATGLFRACRGLDRVSHLLCTLPRGGEVHFRRHAVLKCLMYRLVRLGAVERTASEAWPIRINGRCQRRIPSCDSLLDPAPAKA